MTLIATILIGAGVILITSAYDNVSILQTFQDIINNKPVGTGDKTTSSTTSTQQTSTSTPQTRNV